MKRRLISLVCALSMVFSVLGGFSMINVSADAPQTLTNAVEVDKATNIATIKLSYEGMTEVSNLQLKLALDPTVFDTTNILAIDENDEYINISFAAKRFESTAMVYTDGKLGMTWVKSNANAPGKSDFATIKLPLKADATYPTTLSFTGVQFRDIQTEGAVKYGSSEEFNETEQMTFVEATLEDPNPPAATPTPEPTPTPRATLDPSVTRPPMIIPTTAPSAEPSEEPSEEPVPTPVPKDQKLINTITVDNNIATIKLSYEGMTEVSNLQLKLALDPAVFDTTNILAIDENDEYINISFAAKRYESTAMVYTDGKLGMTWVKSNANAPGKSDFATIKLPLKADATYPTTLSFTGVQFRDIQTEGAVKYGSSEEFNETEPMTFIEATLEDPNAQPTAKPTAKPTPTPVPTPKPPVKEIADASTVLGDVKDEVKTEEDNDVPVSMTITFTAGNETFTSDDETKYGVDNDWYIVDNTGKVVPFDEVQNTLNGYNGKLSDKLPTWSVKFNNPNITKAEAEAYAWKATGTEVIKPSEPVTPVTPATPTPSPTPTPTPGDDNQGGNNQGGNQTGNNGASGGAKPGSGQIAGGGNLVGGTAASIYTDIAHVGWASQAITGLTAAGVVNGRTATTFDPDANVTRAEFAKMIVTVAGLTPAGTAPFADSASHWASSYIAVANANGIVTGYNDAEFAPDKTITRQEMAAIVYRAASVAGKTLPAVNNAITFSDNAAINDYAKTAVSTLQQAGIINGMGDGTFAPTANATRAQAAVIVWNFFGAK